MNKSSSSHRKFQLNLVYVGVMALFLNQSAHAYANPYSPPIPTSAGPKVSVPIPAPIVAKPKAAKTDAKKDASPKGTLSRFESQPLSFFSIAPVGTEVQPTRFGFLIDGVNTVPFPPPAPPSTVMIPPPVLFGFIQADGFMRYYNFNRNFSNPKNGLVPIPGLPAGLGGSQSQNASAFGGILNLVTVPFFTGFQLGVTGFLTTGLGLNSQQSGFAATDATLPSYEITTLGQAYAQYSNKYFLVKAGNMLVNTPWANGADVRILPATFQGYYAAVTPIKDLYFFGMRFFRWKSRTSTDFQQFNLYSAPNTTTYIFGGSPIAGYGLTTNPGVGILGTQYKVGNFTTQGWYYRFYNIANLAYADASYQFINKMNIYPIIGVQFLREYGDGSNQLAGFTSLPANPNPALPKPIGEPNADVYGALVGIVIKNLTVTAAFDDIPIHQTAFNAGGIVSPYTTGYAYDPLYTTQMIAGMVEKASGTSYKVAATYLGCDKKLRLYASFARYYTAPNFPNTKELDFDAGYDFSQILHGFSVRDRIGFENGLSPSRGQFIYNRLQLQLNF